MKLYLSGPMTGYPQHNHPAFHRTAARLRAAGYEVVNPAELDDSEEERLSWEDYLRRDLTELLKCGGIATLPGWANSRGARLEIDVADRLSMPINRVDGWEREAIKHVS